ncbi:MAG: flavodoxin family protein [Clostridium sp.]|uniref:flavodoxin family protein BilS n=1 Tax=Clostridia TaxID=186801 RepID=UPI00067F00DC|nr:MULTISPECIES: flavodoxin family protein BilS [Clostridia]MBS6765772.1 flavodoxin family protein [Clostridium sp.]MDU7708013.1 flavodoxin family protein [Clostridium sp.]
MTYEIVFDSATGNTKLLAEKIKESMERGKCAYFGGPTEAPAQSELIFAGFWTDRGNCSEGMRNFLERLNEKEVFLFGTAGFGVMREYFDSILERVEAYLPESCTVKGTFMCQGRMQENVKKRYEAMLENDPADARIKAMLDNYEKALPHPNSEDLQELEERLKKL